MAATHIHVPRHGVTPAKGDVALSGRVHALATRPAPLAERELEQARKVARIIEILSYARDKNGTPAVYANAAQQVMRMMDRACDLLALQGSKR